MYRNRELRRGAIAAKLAEHCKQGDAYLPLNELLRLCLADDPALEKDVFLADVDALSQSGFLRNENGRIYTAATLLGENTAADCLAHILELPKLDTVCVPEAIELENGICLTEEQRIAVSMGLSNRISMIIGGAGTGKSTIIHAMKMWYHGFRFLALAPTGKAVRNLIEHGIIPAKTIHSALGIKDADDDGDSIINWENIKMVCIDEVSMVTTRLLAMLLSKLDDSCKVVLLGDEQQLPPIGAGNIISDLCALGIPHIRLLDNHRLHGDAHCLANNVVHYDEMLQRQDLKFGTSFDMIPVIDELLADRVAKDAAEKIINHQNVQVICPYNQLTAVLNTKIRNIVNPPSINKYEIHYKSTAIRDEDRVFRDGDRVIITQNDRDRGVYNGDIGTLRILRNDEKNLRFSIIISKTRTILWCGQAAIEQCRHMLLAYAITVHRAQGSEYDCVMMLIATWMKNMLTRNLFYTSISRAKQQMLLYGDPGAIDMALANELPARRSMLVNKVQNLLNDSFSMPV